MGFAAGVPFEAYLDLARAALDDVADLGPVAALTGPVARGDEATVRRHVKALPVSERKAYGPWPTPPAPWPRSARPCPEP